MVTKAQMAVVLQVTYRTITKIMGRGEIPFFRIGGKHVRFRVEEALARMEGPLAREVRSPKSEGRSPKAVGGGTAMNYLPKTAPSQVPQRRKPLRGSGCREKGKRGERQWRDELRAHGFHAQRGQQFAGSPESADVICDELIEIAFRAPARTERCAGEGELIFGLTKHGATLPTPERGVNRQFLPIFLAEEIVDLRSDQAGWAFPRFWCSIDIRCWHAN